MSATVGPVPTRHVVLTETFVNVISVGAELDRLRSRKHVGQTGGVTDVEKLVVGDGEAVIPWTKLEVFVAYAPRTAVVPEMHIQIVDALSEKTVEVVQAYEVKWVILAGPDIVSEARFARWPVLVEVGSYVSTEWMCHPTVTEITKNLWVS